MRLWRLTGKAASNAIEDAGYVLKETHEMALGLWLDGKDRGLASCEIAMKRKEMLSLPY
jgi:hypothetical protein